MALPCAALLPLLAAMSGVSEANVEAPLIQVRLSAVPESRANPLAQQLRDLGIDVQHGHTDQLSWITTQSEYHRLFQRAPSQLRRLLASAVIQTGRPFRAIENERRDRSDVPGYPETSEIEAELRELADTYPEIFELFDLTETLSAPATSEGRHIFAIRVADEAYGQSLDPKTFIVSGHHAREVVTPVIALEFLKRLGEGWGQDAEVDAIVEEHELWVAPLWNPDGYQYVFDRDNLWRKNRRRLSSGSYGVDLNRNYDFQWDGPCGGETNTAHETYRGPSVGSEPETKTAVALSEREYFAKVIDFHSHGRQVVWGYGKCDRHPFDRYTEAGAERLGAKARYSERLPSANGEHVQWHRIRGTWNYLVETHIEFQPPIAEARAEAERVWPLLVEALDWRAPLAGRVVDACTDQAIAARIDMTDVEFRYGEHFLADPTRGRFDIFAPDGLHQLEFASPGYQTEQLDWTFDANNPMADLEVRLLPEQVDEEICDGIDNDCDGSVDELPECEDNSSETTDPDSSTGANESESTVTGNETEASGETALDEASNDESTVEDDGLDLTETAGGTTDGGSTIGDEAPVDPEQDSGDSCRIGRRGRLDLLLVPIAVFVGWNRLRSHRRVRRRTTAT